jgi:hypothetical protein
MTRTLAEHRAAEASSGEGLMINELRWPLSEYAERMKSKVLPEAWGDLYNLVAYAEHLEGKWRAEYEANNNLLEWVIGQL